MNANRSWDSQMISMWGMALLWTCCTSAVVHEKKVVKRSIDLDVGMAQISQWTGWELSEVIIEAQNRKLFEDKSSFIFSRTTWMSGLNDDGTVSEISKGVSEP